MPDDPFEEATRAAARLQVLTGRPTHDAAVILGSGWLPAADVLAGGTPVTEVPFSEIGGFPEPTVAGHGGGVRSFEVSGRAVLVFLGRVHLYEGNSPAAVVHGVRAAVMAGCRSIVLTNAAGGLNPSYRVGQPVLIADHLNLTAASPLEGPPPPEGFAPRFVDLSDLYSADLRAVARREEPSLEEGVYAALRGPHYETRAEVAMLRALGGDLVGMSTALEAIAARHLGASVLGLSLVTNAAAGISHEGINHAEVLAAGASAAGAVGSLLARLLPYLP